MFYVIGDGQIIDQYDSYNPPEQGYLQALADDCDLDELWVIRGEHSGITWERPEPTPEPTPKPRLVFGEPVPLALMQEAHRQQRLEGIG